MRRRGPTEEADRGPRPVRRRQPPVEPIDPDAPFEFVDAVVGGAVPRQFIGAVRNGIEKAMARGGPKGYPVVGLRVTLLDGKFHSVDSSEAAFDTAGSMGLRAALESAGTVVLERVMEVTATFPTEFLGDVLNDLSARRGKVWGRTTTSRGTPSWSAHVPEAELTATGSTCAPSPPVAVASRSHWITWPRHPRRRPASSRGHARTPRRTSRVWPKEERVEDPFNLARFVEAQDRGGSYDQALREIHDGAKYSHWIWWVFPQLQGLGRSPTSKEYSINSIDEAKAYLQHPVLGPRLRDAAQAMIGHVGMSAAAILQWDDVKFHSSMTLFMRAAPDEPLFRAALRQFFDGEPDAATDQLLEGRG